MQRDPRVFLWDVQQAAEAITQFTAGLAELRSIECELAGKKS
jgi:uncharacterized protein with HEPN domain